MSRPFFILLPMALMFVVIFIIFELTNRPVS
jgi:hypothetical protein